MNRSSCEKVQLLIISRNVAADVGTKRSERDETVTPPVVEDKRHPAVSTSYIPATRIVPPVNQVVNSPASPKPPPARTEEDDDYDSDDASKADLSS